MGLEEWGPVSPSVCFLVMGLSRLPCLSGCQAPLVWLLASEGFPCSGSCRVEWRLFGEIEWSRPVPVLKWLLCTTRQYWEQHPVGHCIPCRADYTLSIDWTS